MPAKPSSAPPPCRATLRTNQPRAHGIDVPNGLGGGFPMRLVELALDGHLAGLSESQIPRAGATPDGADAAHVPRLLVEQAGVSKLHFSGSSRLT
ncbi:MAG TPA: hypothetical protein VK729_14985 [Silvibacterium sp.]|jgi:hypothetical protein|nr:hypothetical protein [Silvibacterium sp.]